MDERANGLGAAPGGGFAARLRRRLLGAAAPLMETAFSSPLWNADAPGTYRCLACVAPLFRSEAKFDSGTGWPSFTAPVGPGAVTETAEAALLGSRAAVACAACGARLGYRFGDGPQPAGLRYCINGGALAFEPAEAEGLTAG